MRAYTEQSYRYGILYVMKLKHHDYSLDKSPQFLHIALHMTIEIVKSMHEQSGD